MKTIKSLALVLGAILMLSSCGGGSQSTENRIPQRVVKTIKYSGQYGSYYIHDAKEATDSNGGLHYNVTYSDEKGVVQGPVEVTANQWKKIQEDYSRGAWRPGFNELEIVTYE